MKRTKDGGAILDTNEGEVKLTRAEFLEGRVKRDMIRIGIILVGAIADLFLIKSSGIVVIGLIFVMLGWRLKTGW